MLRFASPFHTLAQSVPLTLSRMWNGVHSVLVKSVTHNVSSPPPLFPAERGPVYCALGSSTHVVTLGFPVAQWFLKLGPVLVQPLFALQMLIIDWHSGLLPVQSELTGVVMYVCMVCV